MPLRGSVFSVGQQGSRQPLQRERLWGQQHHAGSLPLLTGKYNPQCNLIPFWSLRNNIVNTGMPCFAFALRQQL